MHSKLIGLLLCCLIGQGEAQTSLKRLNLEYGAYSVGFQHEIRYDSSRSYRRQSDWAKHSMPRPIPISMWYPAGQKPNGKVPMLVLDYMEILKEEEEWEYLPNEEVLNWFYYPNTPENQAHLMENSQAYQGLSAAPGPFPVVLYAPSYQASSIENFALCEYLASHGFLVLASPSRGAQTRWMEGATAKDMETQARDIEFLLGGLTSYPQAHRERIATMGFSFGGLSQVLAQMRHEQIDAVLSLDGSIRYVPETLERSPFYSIAKADVPFLHMAQKDIPESVLKEDGIDPRKNSEFSYYDSLHACLAYRLKMEDLSHAHFSTLGVLFQPRDTRQDKSEAKIMASYNWMCQYSLHFLNAFLKDEASSRKFVDNIPEANGVAPGLIRYQKKAPDTLKASFEDFHEQAQAQDYQNLLSLYKSFQTREADFQIPEWKLNNLGLHLVFHPQGGANGIAIFSLATSLYPNSSNLYDSMAEGYLFLGEKEKAIQSFRKSLELDANNLHAAKRLEELEK